LLVDRCSPFAPSVIFLRLGLGQECPDRRGFGGRAQIEQCTRNRNRARDGNECGQRRIEIPEVRAPSSSDGSVEAHDVLRIAGGGLSETVCNIFDRAIDDIRNEPRW
jgi:hypothetical protein